MAANSTTSPASQREAEQELHRADDLVQHALHLRDAGRDVDVGDVREVARSARLSKPGVPGGRAWKALM
jgi:hypothetical protein